MMKDQKKIQYLSKCDLENKKVHSFQNKAITLTFFFLHSPLGAERKEKDIITTEKKEKGCFIHMNET